MAETSRPNALCKWAPTRSGTTARAGASRSSKNGKSPRTACESTIAILACRTCPSFRRDTLSKNLREQRGARRHGLASRISCSRCRRFRCAALAEFDCRAFVESVSRLEVWGASRRVGIQGSDQDATALAWDLSSPAKGNPLLPNKECKTSK